MGLSRCAVALGGVMIENPWQPTRWPTSAGPRGAPAGAQAEAGRGWEAGLRDTGHLPRRKAGPLSWAEDRPWQVSLSTPKDRNSPAGHGQLGARLLWGCPSTQHGPGHNERPCRAVWGGSRGLARAAVGPLSSRGSLPSARCCPPVTGSPSIRGSPGQ